MFQLCKLEKYTVIHAFHTPTQLDICHGHICCMEKLSIRSVDGFIPHSRTWCFALHPGMLRELVSMTFSAKLEFYLLRQH